MIILLENSGELTSGINETWLGILNYIYSKICNFSRRYDNQCKYILYILLLTTTKNQRIQRNISEKIYPEFIQGTVLKILPNDIF